MEKKFTRITFFIGAISSLSYLVFIFLSNYNSPENIEERCIAKFQKDTKKGLILFFNSSSGFSINSGFFRTASTTQKALIPRTIPR